MHDFLWSNQSARWQSGLQYHTALHLLHLCLANLPHGPQYVDISAILLDATGWQMPQMRRATE
jgi:hypothetical protein